MSAPRHHEAAERIDVRHAYEVNRERIARLWAGAQPITLGDAADYYLRRNGLRPQPNQRWPEALRLHPAMDYWHTGANGQGVCLGHFPALVAVLEVTRYPQGLRAAPHSHAVALQRIYLTPDGEPAAVPSFSKVTGTDGHVRGAAVRVYVPGQDCGEPAHGGALGVAVGLLPALRIARAARMPVWAVTDAAALAHVRWPRHTERLHVFVDGVAPEQNGPAAQLMRKATTCGLEAFAHTVTPPDAVHTQRTAHPLAHGL